MKDTVRIECARGEERESREKQLERAGEICYAVLGNEIRDQARGRSARRTQQDGKGACYVAFHSLA